MNRVHQVWLLSSANWGQGSGHKQTRGRARGDGAPDKWGCPGGARGLLVCSWAEKEAAGAGGGWRLRGQRRGGLGLVGKRAGGAAAHPSFQGIGGPGRSAGNPIRLWPCLRRDRATVRRHQEADTRNSELPDTSPCTYSGCSVVN